MRTRRRTLLAGLVLLAMLAAACLPGTTIPPTTAPVTNTANAPTTVPPTASQAPTTAPSATPLPPTVAPATVTIAATVAASVTSAPAGQTPNVPSGTSTPVANPITHLAAGQAITITSIHMRDTNVGWATGGLAHTGDHVLTTSDGGQTWHDVTPPQPVPPADQGQPNAAVGSFRDANTAWVVYGTFMAAAPAAVTVWHTTDAGHAWTASQPLDLSTLGTSDYFQPSDLRFLGDNQTGFFIAHLGAGMNHDYFTILRTTDGGQTWTHLIDPTAGGPQSCQKTGLHFVDAQNGWLTGDCQGVAPGLFFMRTTDGGATWNNVTLPAPSGQPDIFTRQDAGCGTYSMRVFDAHNSKLAVSCLLLGANTITNTNFIYSTTDGGQNWTSSPAPAHGLTFLNPQIAWALPTANSASPPQYILSQTQDGGQSWTTVKQLAWTGELDFVDAQTGWAVAQADQAISFVKTIDAGHTWQVVNAKISQ